MTTQIAETPRAPARGYKVDAGDDSDIAWALRRGAQDRL